MIQTRMLGAPDSVTVVVGCYNHESFVEQCLESVYAQTHNDVEVIITDDASRDGTQQRVRELLEGRHWNARTVFHSANRGICATFNEALALVRTPYVAFLSADDWMDRERVAKHVAALEAHPKAALVYGNMHLASRDGTPTGETWDSVFEGAWPGGQHVNLFRRLALGNWLPAPTVMSRTLALRSVGGYNESLPYEDHDMWLALSRHGFEFAFLPEPLVFYRKHSEQLTSSVESGLVQAMTRLRMYDGHVGVDPVIDRWLGDKMPVWALDAYRLGGPPRTLSTYFWRAVMTHRSPKWLVIAIMASLSVPYGILGRVRGLLRRFVGGGGVCGQRVALGSRGRRSARLGASRRVG